MIYFSCVSGLVYRFYLTDIWVAFHLFLRSSKTLARPVNFLCSIPVELFHVFLKGLETLS